MDNTAIQAFAWIIAGSLLLLYVKRRRSRRNTP